MVIKNIYKKPSARASASVSPVLWLQCLGLGKEQGQSLGAQVFSVTLAFFRYTLLAYLLEQESQPQTIGGIFHQLEAESGTLTYLQRLSLLLCTFENYR